VRAAPAVTHLVDADDAGVLGDELAELDRLLAAAVVEDDDLEEMLGVVLRGEGGERELERLRLVRRDDDGHRHGRLPVVGEGSVENIAPPVAGDDGGRADTLSFSSHAMSLRGGLVRS